MVNEGYEWLMVSATSVFRHLQQMSGVGWVGFQKGIHWGFHGDLMMSWAKMLIKSYKVYKCGFMGFN